MNLRVYPNRKFYIMIISRNTVNINGIILIYAVLRSEVCRICRSGKYKTAHTDIIIIAHTPENVKPQKPHFIFIIHLTKKRKNYIIITNGFGFFIFSFI